MLSGVLSGEYEMESVVGKGAFGTVWSGVERSTKQKVAIKHIDHVFDNRSDAARTLRELRLLRELRHPNLVAIKGVLLPRSRGFFNEVFVVFELFDSDLSQMIRSQTKYDVTHRRWIMFQMLRGLDHMHTSGYRSPHPPWHTEGAAYNWLSYGFRAQGIPSRPEARQYPRERQLRLQDM
jgi:serine/threonine protein kinase